MYHEFCAQSELQAASAEQDIVLATLRSTHLLHEVAPLDDMPQVPASPAAASPRPLSPSPVPDQSPSTGRASTPRVDMIARVMRTALKATLDSAQPPPHNTTGLELEVSDTILQECAARVYEELDAMLGPSGCTSGEEQEFRGCEIQVWWHSVRLLCHRFSGTNAWIFFELLKTWMTLSLVTSKALP
jgi:hypothetical protein